jgi:VWFA-related protein
VMNQGFRLTVSVWSLLTFSTLCPAQVTPGQIPPGPPPQPGQLGPAPGKAAPSAADKSANPPAKPKAPQEIGSTDPDTFRTFVRNVLVPTTVLDPDGHGYVNGLEAKDFELFDNDKLQSISAEFVQLPMSVVLAVQANSEIEPFLPKLKKAGVLLHGLVTGEGGDVAILAFDHRMQLLQDFTGDPDKIDDAMQKLNSGSRSAALIDAVLESDHMLKRRDPNNARRHVVLLLSRNVDHGSQSRLEETVRQMQFDNVIVYCVDISKALSAVMKKMDYPTPQNGRVPPEALPNILGNGARTDTQVIQQQNGNILNAAPPIFRGIRDLFKKTPAEAFSFFTGGLVYTFATDRALERAITDIGKDLNSQYLLSYSPSAVTTKDPGFHTIRVAVNRPGLKIRTRPGYWWGGGQQ